jgi:hypothetical protein
MLPSAYPIDRESFDNKMVVGEESHLKDVLLAPDASQKMAITYQGSTLWQGLGLMKVSGNYAYCMMPLGLKVYDISNASAPVEVAHYYFSNAEAVKMKIQGNFLFVAGGSSGKLHIFDISNPFNPFLTASYLCGYGPNTLDVSGNYVYTDSQGYAIILDVSDPYNPLLVGKYTVWGGVGNFRVLGTRQYIANITSGFMIYDVSNPHAPVKLGSVPIPSEAPDIEVVGDYAYFQSPSPGMQVIDVSDPANPFIVASHSKYYHELVVNGNVAYAFNYDTLAVLDLTWPMAITEISKKTFPRYHTANLTNGKDLYVFEWNGGFRDIDVSDPSNVSVAGGQSFIQYPACKEVRAAGKYAFVAAGPSGLRVVDVTDKSNPVAVSSVATIGECTSVSIDGSLAVVNDDSVGIHLIDISNPTSPSLISSYAMPEYVTSVALHQNLAFAADYYRGLTIVDFSVPVAPSLVGELTIPGGMRRIIVDGNYAYLSGEGASPVIVDISNPQAPALVSSVPSNNHSSTGLSVSGNSVFVGTSDDYIRSFDISSPQSPLLQSSLKVTSSPWDFAFAENYLYAADYTFVLVVNVTDPITPKLSGQFPSYPSWSFGVAISGDYIYVAGDNGFMVLKKTAVSCGDANLDGIVNISDAISLINYVFANGQAPNPVDAGDVNCDKLTNISDVVFIVQYIFANGAAPCVACK